MGLGKASSGGHEERPDHVAANVTAYGEDGVGVHTLEILEEADSYNRWIADFFRSHLGEANLELGAGRGTLSKIVGETHRVVPFEISEPQRRFVEQRFAGHPRVLPCRSDVFDCRDWGAFDCVYSANVLEHIEDDEAILSHCARLLRPSAWCVAFVPAHQWLYSRFDRKIGHFRRYGRADARRLMRLESEDTVLELRQFRYVNMPGALGWFLKMRVLESTSIQSKDAEIVGRLVPVIRMLDALHLPLGQNAVLVWQRTR